MKETKKQKEKIAKVMHEFKEGELHIGKSDKVVKNPKQAIAIALSEANASKMAEGGSIEHTFEISKIKEIVERNINLNNYKIQREDDKVLLLTSKRKDISIDFRLDFMPNEIWFGGFAKLEVSSVSLADPLLRYQNTSARRVVHKKINVRKAVSSYLALEKLLKNFLTKVGELNKMQKGGNIDKTITVEVYGGKKINYTDSEIQEMIDEIDMYMSSDNLPKWIIQSRKNGNINFPKDKKGVLEFLNKIKDSKNDVYINVDSTIPPFKHYIKMANGGEVSFSPVAVEKANLEQLFDMANEIGLSNYHNLNKEILRKKVLEYFKLNRFKGKMADGGKVGEDFKFNYMMLDRLQSDNDYYLKHPDEKNLWAGSVDKQISEMKKLWNQLPKDKKPEWLSMEDILEYEKKMKKNYAKGGDIGECYYTIGGL